MFAYDKRDHTTYTDPELVHHLVKRLRELGFENLNVVEAQSTYGEYFDKRSVREMAEYLGYDGKAGYEVVDMTLDADEMRHLGPHLGNHPVSRSWREADFRISFAKNKTHAYAYYTLTLKNIYGALPLANKFKEYHCGRGIYETTIEYLTAFPVDYGLVDAYLSADGPFGIFADPAPNETNTIIGGTDLVAVDWIAAGKMGIDPMISPVHEARGRGLRQTGNPPYRRSEPLSSLAERAGRPDPVHEQGSRREPLLREPHVLGRRTDGRDALPAQEPGFVHAAASEDDRSAAPRFLPAYGRKPVQGKPSVQFVVLQDGFLTRGTDLPS